jgi:hypothetical protein
MKRFRQQKLLPLSPPLSKEQEEEEQKRQCVLREQIVLQITTGEDLNRLNSHPRDALVEFVEDGHYYIDKQTGGRFRVSTTGWKGFFTTPYDEEINIKSKFGFPINDDGSNDLIHSSKVGAKPGSSSVPPDLGLTRYQTVVKIRQKASFGTMMHAKIEHYINRQGNGNYLAAPMETRLAVLLGTGEPSESEMRCAIQMLRAEDDYLKQGWRPYRVEWSIFSSKLQKAGQIDMVLRRMAPDGRYEYCVVDWKTTSTDPRKVDNRQKRNTMFYPIEKLSNCQATGYKLQMSDYATTLINEYGLNVVEIRAIVLDQTKNFGFTLAGKPLVDEVKQMNDVWWEFLELEKLLVRWHQRQECSSFLPDMAQPLYYSNKPPSSL